MPAIAEIKEQLEDVETLQFLAQAFTEASALKIKKIKALFDTNKLFYEEISNVYHLVKISALIQKRNIHKKALQAEESKTLSIALTSNARFYGHLNVATMENFVKETKKYKTDLLIIGQTGKDYLRAINFNLPHEKMTFRKDSPTPEEVKNLIEKIKDYDTVYLFYPKFATMLTQNVGKVDITQSAEMSKIDKNDIIEYIFEPELDKIIDFFESVVRALLFNRALLEAELSRTAARLMVMSSAEERANDEIKIRKVELTQATRAIKNAQLIETFAGRKAWKKH